MSSENQTNIRFSLKETVWFQKGQEVKEVRSLSLNPDITIQQFDEYVQVKGVLTLEGNYSPDQADQGDYISLRELAPSRLVEDVVLLEDGSYELRHQFPVDISIPLTRITDLENLCVSVETFDYQLAEKGSIQIAADLCISGLHDNRAVDNYHEQRAHEQYNAYNYSNDYRTSNDEENEENREQEEQFQFFNQPPTDLTEEKDNLYGSDWIQSLEEEQEVEVQTYPQQPTYLEVFRPAEVEQVQDENSNQSQTYLEEEDSSPYVYNAELSNEQTLEFEFEEQNQENTVNDNNFVYNQEQSVEQTQEYQELYRENNDIAEQDLHANTESTPYPSFNNGFNIQPNILNNEVNQRPSFLNNDYSALQNYANNTQNETQNFEEQFNQEQYNRSVEQSHQQYFNNQFQQPPFNYNQQPYYQNPFPQGNQAIPYANPNDIRQTPPYYAEYYQAQVEQEQVHVEHIDDNNNAEAQESDNRSKVRSDNLLTSLFTGEGKEESYSKLKLYLAQNGDTVESVAKKYNLQTQQLNRVNNLNDEFLSEGQIIYIPITAIKQ
ncbi:LysM peptidoglycan-binding domain-containing protein [Bacillus sp. EAC]|uniref:LysM peptidoglycan-binding domain-containing protein n=1 Tax=Bacillus sp. EAC TaxID=1978338 RepID=UPI0015C514D3|nr:LysM peptidoglycan-binding domain-containing protein [Bacillus sp. EAC]